MILFAICFGLWGFPARAPSPDPCGAGLKSARARLEKLPISQRIGPTLEVIGASCRGLDPAMADAAVKAAKAPRRERAALLAAGQKVCAVPDPAAPAQTVVGACPPGERDPQGPILKALDAGTYVFVRALRQALEKAGTDTNAELVLSSLALAAALEGEAANKK